MVSSRRTLAVFFAIAAIMAIFPPWIVREGRYRSFGPPHAGGYSFIATPPSNGVIATLDFGRLAVQYFALSAIAVVSIVIESSRSTAQATNVENRGLNRLPNDEPDVNHAAQSLKPAVVVAIIAGVLALAAILVTAWQRNQAEPSYAVINVEPGSLDKPKPRFPGIPVE